MEIQNNTSLKTIYGASSVEDKKVKNDTFSQSLVKEKQETVTMADIKNEEKTSDEILQVCWMIYVLC